MGVLPYTVTHKLNSFVSILSAYSAEAEYCGVFSIRFGRVSSRQAGGGYTIRLRFNCNLSALYDHSTTYETTVGLCVRAAATRPN